MEVVFNIIEKLVCENIVTNIINYVYKTKGDSPHTSLSRTETERERKRERCFLHEMN